MSILAVILICLAVVGVCVSGGMIFSGVMLMRDEPPSRRWPPLSRALFWVDILLNSGLGFLIAGVIRNWRHRPYARITILKGIMVGLVTFVITWLAIRVLVMS